MVCVVRSPLLPLWGLLGLLCSLLGLLCSCSAQTPFQKFQAEHVKPNTLPCDQTMLVVNTAARKCTPTHTFPRKCLQDVISVCMLPQTLCRSDQKKCHQSACPVSMTEYQLIGKGQFPDCNYTDTHSIQNFVVACAPRQRGDPQYPLLPVDLD